MATSNLRKAAVFLQGLPEPLASELRGKLGPEQEAAIVEELKTLGKVDAAEQVTVMREFAKDRAEHLDRLSPAQTTPFAFLHDMDAETLIDLIGDEHPQTIALVLSRLPPHQSAEVLPELSSELQLSVICRLATMQEPSPEVVRDVEQGLRQRLFSAAEPSSGGRGVAGVVEMFHAMDPVTERKLLSKLAEAEPELVREIRRAMFGIDLAVPEACGAEQVAC